MQYRISVLAYILIVATILETIFTADMVRGKIRNLLQKSNGLIAASYLAIVSLCYSGRRC